MTNEAHTTAINLVSQFEASRRILTRTPEACGPSATGPRVTPTAIPVCSTTPCVSMEDAKELVERDLRSAFATVQRDIKVPLTPEQTAALADFVLQARSGQSR